MTRVGLARSTASLALLLSTIPIAHADGILGMARQGPNSSTRLEEGVASRAPFAFLRYCVENPRDCRSGSRDDVKWSREAKSLVDRINTRITDGIGPAHEAEESRKAGVDLGDCKDFALTKRRALVDAGFPSSSLRVAVAKTTGNELHAVLVVKTNVGDFVLDKRTDRVLLANRTDLARIKIASAADPRVWHLVN